MAVWSTRTDDDGRPIPLGHITHLLDNERHPVVRFDDIVDFIASYLEEREG